MKLPRSHRPTITTYSFRGFALMAAFSICAAAQTGAPVAATININTNVTTSSNPGNRSPCSNYTQRACRSLGNRALPARHE